VRTDIELCKAVYSLGKRPDVVAIEVFCQCVVLNDCAYAWIDGIDSERPMLVPIEDLTDFSRQGTLGQYLRDERHMALGEYFDEFLDLCLGNQISPTLMVRACEFMHSDALHPIDALRSAKAWGDFINEVDGADRCMYHHAGLNQSPC